MNKLEKLRDIEIGIIKKFFCFFIVSSSCVLLTLEPAKIVEFAIVHYTSGPPIPAPIPSDPFVFFSFSWASVLSVLFVIGFSKVGSSIVKFVHIDMVNLFGVKYQLVHKDTFTFPAFYSVASSAYRPSMPRDKLEIFIINYGKSSTFGERIFFHVFPDTSLEAVCQN
jgi:hypothetical protein